MSRRAAIFTVTDVARAMRGAEKAGIPVARYEITGDGRIVIVTLAGAALDAPALDDVDSNLTPLERWRQKRDARQTRAGQSSG